MGSGDAGTPAITTAEQSVSPSARTARGNEAEATPNPVLEALADQTSDRMMLPPKRAVKLRNVWEPPERPTAPVQNLGRHDDYKADADPEHAPLERERGGAA